MSEHCNRLSFCVLFIRFAKEKGHQKIARKVEIYMAGWIECASGKHAEKMKLYEAAKRLSKNRLGRCSHLDCGKPLQYWVQHDYANAAGQHNFQVIRAARLWSDAEVEERDGFDPFLLLLQDENDPENRKILPIFWAPDKSGKARGGQFPPILAPEEWKILFRKLNATCDERDWAQSDEESNTGQSQLNGSGI